MHSHNAHFLDVGKGASSRRIACHFRTGAQPGLFWLGGFASGMQSTKALALDAFCEKTGRACVRFDYTCIGASGGNFEQATLTTWLEDSQAVFAAAPPGRYILIGSSMGAWLALLLARKLRDFAALILIAPAVDFTQTLLWPRLCAQDQATLMHTGRLQTPHAVYTKALIEDAKQHLLFNTLIRAYAPVHILQGQQDDTVPYTHALKLVEHMPADPVTLTLIKDGDHRLSREQDLQLIINTVESISA